MQKKVEKFELVVFDEEDNEEFVEYVEFSEFDEGFNKFKTTKELYDARKLKFGHLDNTKLIESKSTYRIVTESDEMEV